MRILPPSTGIMVSKKLNSCFLLSNDSGSCTSEDVQVIIKKLFISAVEGSLGLELLDHVK